jgi:fructose/tagatose bisphosphate aldolase
MRYTFELACGPMSSQAIEAVFRVSEDRGVQLALIASKNQIDYAGGYVNDWTTAQYMEFVRFMRESYPRADVVVCRDHLGPGFKKKVPGMSQYQDVLNTLESDIEQGFDLVHVDFCHAEGSEVARLEVTADIVAQARAKRSDIGIEVGTDEIGVLRNREHIQREIDWLVRNNVNPDLYVLNTGSKVEANRQAGHFNPGLVEQVRTMLQGTGMRIKEHNADFLGYPQIIQRQGKVGAMNIAP